MTRDQRRLLELAEREGLALVETLRQTKHQRFYFRNAQGDVLTYHCSGGSSSMQDRRALLNMRSKVGSAGSPGRV